MSAPADAITAACDLDLPPRPYPGLRPFMEDEWAIFFGRERMVDEVMARLVDNRLIVIHGDSGCGKSSLIRAGVLPRLEQQFARGDCEWVTCSATPGNDPLGNLAAAVSSLCDSDDEAGRHDIHRLLSSGRNGAEALAQKLCGREARHVCILLDQFEELFAHARHHGRQQASILIDFLFGVHRLKEARFRMILTMRSEFLGACAQYEDFAQVVNAAQYLLPRMERGDLTRAIQEPALLYDGEIAADLAGRLISDARGNQDQLPLIQHALMVLHRDRAAKPGESWRLTLESYAGSGGLSKLLSSHADHVAGTVEPAVAGKSIVEEMFRALTEINADHQAIRRPQTLAQLIRATGADEAALRRIIDGFRAEGASFLRPYGETPVRLEDNIDISHEALIRCWQKIDDGKTGWLTKEFEDGLVWSSLLVQCKNFEEDPKNVLSAATTEERGEWLATRNAAWAERYGGGWDRVQALIEASVLARQEQRTAETKARQLKLVVRALILVGLLLAGTVAMMIYAIGQRSAANRERDVAQAERDKANSATADAFRQQTELKYALEAAAAESKARQVALDSLKQELDAVKHAAASGPQNAGVNYGIKQANEAVKRLDYMNQNVEAVSPRVYIHISDESQRPAARAIEQQIEALSIRGTKIIVPGIQLVKPVSQTILRCFRAEDCKEWGGEIQALLGKLVQSPRIVLNDFSSASKGSSSAIRPLQFELYFAPGEIVPARGAAKY